MAGDKLQGNMLDMNNVIYLHGDLLNLSPLNLYKSQA